MAEIIFSSKNQASLPLSTTYTPDNDAEVELMLNGTAWASIDFHMIGLILEIDGVDVCTASIYSNGRYTHRLLMPGITTYRFNLNISDGSPTPVNIVIKALDGNTKYDTNDSVSLTIL